MKRLFCVLSISFFICLLFNTCSKDNWDDGWLPTEELYLTVLEKDTNIPIENALISLEWRYVIKGYTSYYDEYRTDINGKALIELRNRTLSISCWKYGYKTWSKDGRPKDGGYLTIFLEPN